MTYNLSQGAESPNMDIKWVFTTDVKCVFIVEVPLLIHAAELQLLCFLLLLLFLGVFLLTLLLLP